MSEKKGSELRFAVCVRNEGYEASLEKNKIYVLTADADAEKDGDVRVVDESGEDYLFPQDNQAYIFTLTAAEGNYAQTQQALRAFMRSR